MTNSDKSIRIDKWLWFARFFKNRTICSRVITTGKVRINGKRVLKASSAIRRGDSLTFQQANTLRIVRVLDLGVRRGKASEAQLLYEDVGGYLPVKDIIYSKQIPVDLSCKEFSVKPSKKQRRKILDLKQSYYVDY